MTPLLSLIEVSGTIEPEPEPEPEQERMGGDVLFLIAKMSEVSVNNFLILDTGNDKAIKPQLSARLAIQTDRGESRAMYWCCLFTH